MDDEDKAIDYLSKKREREEHCEEFCSNGNNLLEDYGIERCYLIPLKYNLYKTFLKYVHKILSL